MNALPRPAIAARTFSALAAARAANLAYCNDEAKDHSGGTLRTLSPIELMYAYFGADETGR